jgi:hypothetical protein
VGGGGGDAANTLKMPAAVMCARHAQTMHRSSGAAPREPARCPIAQALVAVRAAAPLALAGAARRQPAAQQQAGRVCGCCASEAGAYAAGISKAVPASGFQVLRCYIESSV